MMRPMRRAGTLLGAVLLATTLASCGSASPEYDEVGIDELVIPTPSPDPDDFLGYIDNPWLAYEQGSEWRYDVNDGATATVRVEPSNLLVGGVRVTSVVTETMVGEGPALSTTDYFAQDRDGNVWWFGRAGEWDVTVAGAEAGLAMPASPRVGDGWRLALLDGVVEDRATVLSVDEGSLVLRVESDLDAGVVVERTYDQDVGLVATFNSEGPSGSTELVSGP